MPERSIADLVQAAVKGEYDIPEFQREFIWKPAQVSQLVDSLSNGYPIGCLVVWKSTTTEEKEQIYVVDGQQRITALCILFGERPYWQDAKDWTSVSAS